jgi:hypothetical protein
MATTIYKVPKSKVKLPKKPSALLRLALADLEKAEKSPRVKINMGEWHETNGHCTVEYS